MLKRISTASSSATSTLTQKGLIYDTYTYICVCICIYIYIIYIYIYPNLIFSVPHQKLHTCWRPIGESNWCFLRWKTVQYRETHYLLKMSRLIWQIWCFRLACLTFIKIFRTDQHISKTSQTRFLFFFL